MGQRGVREKGSGPTCEAGSGAWALSDVGWYGAQRGKGGCVPGKRCHVGLSVWTPDWQTGLSLCLLSWMVLPMMLMREVT